MSQDKGTNFARPLNQSELLLYLEVAPEGKALHRIERDEFLLLFKLYDPINARLGFLGKCFAKKHWKLPDLVPLLNKIANFPEDTLLEVQNSPLSVAGAASLDPIRITRPRMLTQALCQDSSAFAPLFNMY